MKLYVIFSSLSLPGLSGLPEHEDEAVLKDMKWTTSAESFLFQA